MRSPAARQASGIVTHPEGQPSHLETSGAWTLGSTCSPKRRATSFPAHGLPPEHSLVLPGAPRVTGMPSPGPCPSAASPLGPPHLSGVLLLPCSLVSSRSSEESTGEEALASSRSCSCWARYWAGVCLARRAQCTSSLCSKGRFACGRERRRRSLPTGAKAQVCSAARSGGWQPALLWDPGHTARALWGSSSTVWEWGWAQ